MKRIFALFLLVFLCCAFQAKTTDILDQVPENPLSKDIQDYFGEKLSNSVYKDLSLTNGAFGFPPIPGKMILAMIVAVTLLFGAFALVGRGHLQENPQDHGSVVWINASGKEKSLVVEYWVHRDNGNSWTNLEGSKDPSEFDIQAVLTHDLKMSDVKIPEQKKCYRDLFKKASRYKTRTAFLESALEILDDAFFENGYAPLGCSACLLDLYKNRIYWAAVGNIFLFIVREGNVAQLNRTHTMADAAALNLLNGRQLDSLEYNFADRTLTSMLGGGSMPEVDRNVKPFPIKPNDKVLLLSSNQGIPDKKIIHSILADPTESSYDGDFILFDFRHKGSQK